MKEYDLMFVLPMPTMRIVGGYKMVYEYANYISKKGYKVCIMYNGCKGNNSRNFPRWIVYAIRKFLGFFGPTWFKLDKHIDKKVIPSFDVKKIPKTKRIVATTAVSSRFINRLKIDAKKYYFIQDFENWEISDEEVIETYKYDMTKITVAKWLKNKVDNNSMDKAIYIPNGLNTKVFRMIKKTGERYPHSISMLYHLDERKGVDIGFRVINKLKKIYPDLVVNMFGSFDKDEQWPEWIKYTKNASPEQVSEIMNDSRVFLCTSRIEGYGLTGLESLFCGCSLVSTNCRGVLDYASEKSALICDVDDVENLTKCVSKVFEEDIGEKMHCEFEKYKNVYDIESSKEKFYEVLIG